MSEETDYRGVVWATTAGGQKLPVIDVTQPRFALADDAAANAALFRAFMDTERRRARTPKEYHRRTRCDGRLLSASLTLHLRPTILMLRASSIRAFSDCRSLSVTAKRDTCC